MPAVVVVCLWAGIWAASGRRTRRDILGAGLVAGASAGLVASALDVVVVIGLLMAQVLFGLWIYGLPSVVAGQFQPVTVTTMAGNLLNISMLLAAVEGLLGAAPLGAAIGAIGAALRAILPGGGGHPDQHPIAS